MTTKKFIVRLCLILVCFSILTIAALSVSNIANTIIQNHLAIGQLENDDTGFIFMETYNGLIRPCGMIVLSACYFVMIVLVLLYVVKFIQFKINLKKEVNSYEEDC